jgi:hypothetical protein
MWWGLRAASRPQNLLFSLRQGDNVALPERKGKFLEGHPEGTRPLQSSRNTVTAYVRYRTKEAMLSYFFAACSGLS